MNNMVVMTKAEKTAVLRRCLAGFFYERHTTEWPDVEQSKAVTYKGLDYVVLRDKQGSLIAVYRIRTDEMKKLKRLRRYPEGIK